uniref:Uncharacterized protein n=1 Tax=Candidatus Methanophaga sp. ANME-1 ERB7 TaxID=2759913 RepID=A0A7G9Z9T5_9EURY|nr:hypothetical protein PEKJEAHP_00020 [Methanosarcinales archaeon ANME-1 ERB7]
MRRVRELPVNSLHLLKIMGKTQFAEIPKKSRKLIEKLEYLLPEEPITKKG